MRQHLFNTRLLLIISAVLTLLVYQTPASIAETTQTITLHPGWNAVYLEVQPEVRIPATVFRDLPVESVWTWFDRTSSVEFIRDPAEGLWAQPGWSVYATAPEKSATNNLYAIFANRAYLIKLGGRQSVAWTVTGSPATDKTIWTSDSFNLTGFHVNPANPANFTEFLSSSAAHAGQQVYRLSSQGKWELITTPAATTIKSGEAYWVYCDGASSFQSPVDVRILGSEIGYGTTSDINSVTLDNQSSTTRSVTIKFLPSADWFTYQMFNATTGYNEYPKLDIWTLQLSAGRQTNIWLAVRRELLTNGISRGILEVTDDVGSRYMIQVTVEKQAQ